MDSSRFSRHAPLALGAVAVLGGMLLTGTAAGAHRLPEPTIRRDELIVRGTDRGDRLALRLAPADPARLEIDFGDDGDAEFEVDRARFDRIEVRLLRGDDAARIDDSNGTFTDTEISTLIGGGGADSIIGGGGVERFFGGGGPDSVDGGGGNDSAWLGAGDDQFQWDPGEGSDLVEGMDGTDTMLFNGSSGNERFETMPNAGRVRFTRDLGNIVMDLDDVEQIDLDTFDGRDTMVVRELGGTDLAEFNADLEVTEDSGVGDAQTDLFTLFATDGDDDITVSGAAGSAHITGAVPTINLTRAVLPDVMQVLGLAGDDRIDGSALPADAIGYGTSGHDGDDRLLGGAGADSIDGGNGTDFVDGGRDDDSAFLGRGDDIFQWDPGEGSDIVGGEDGHDTMLFNGSGQNEAFVTAADEFGGATFSRDLGNIVMSLDRVEQIDLDALGGADTVLVDDLGDFRGTGLEIMNAALGAGDRQADALTVNGTASSFPSDGADSVTVIGDAASVGISGLSAAVNVTAAEPIDSLIVHGLDGGDTIDATDLAGNILRFFANGDAGDDTLHGSPGDDVLDGGDGYDVLLGGAGEDLLLNGEVVSDD